jgi:hypothetical protein
MSIDTTFFTNEPNVLVGYFRTSGFYRLYDALEGIDKIRILVGLSVDRVTYEILEETQSSVELDFESHSKIEIVKSFIIRRMTMRAFLTIVAKNALHRQVSSLHLIPVVNRDDRPTK